MYYKSQIPFCQNREGPLFGLPKPCGLVENHENQENHIKYKGFGLPAGSDLLKIFGILQNFLNFLVNSQILDVPLEESRDSAPRAGKIIGSVESEVLQKLIPGR